MFYHDIEKAIALLQELQSHVCVDQFSDLLSYKLHGLNSTLDTALRSFELGRLCQDTSLDTQLDNQLDIQLNNQLDFSHDIDEDDCIIHSVFDDQLHLPAFQEFYASSLANEFCSGSSLVQVTDQATQVTHDIAVQVSVETHGFGDFLEVADCFQDTVDVVEIDQGWRSVSQGYSREYAEMKFASRYPLFGVVDENYFSVLDFES